IGSIIGVFASVAPTIVMLIVLLGFLLKFKDSPRGKKLTQIIRPPIAILLGVMTYEFFFDSYSDVEFIITVVLIVAGYLFVEIIRVSRAYAVLGALIYGAVFLGG